VARFGTFSGAISGPEGAPGVNTKRESLGKKILEGLEVEGERVTTTIPAGQIGNERPIETSFERWYSPALKTVIMSRHSDPRMGESRFSLTNVSQTEPPRWLFEVPPEYTLESGPPFPMPPVPPVPGRPPVPPAPPAR